MAKHVLVIGATLLDTKGMPMAGLEPGPSNPAEIRSGLPLAAMAGICEARKPGHPRGISPNFGHRDNFLHDKFRLAHHQLAQWSYFHVLQYNRITRFCAKVVGSPLGEDNLVGEPAPRM